MTAPSTVASPAILTALHRVVDGCDLTEGEAFAALSAIFDGGQPEAPVAALLTALRMKGETADELFGAARAMRERVVPVAHGLSKVLDTCGTGGDGQHTFNVSTLVAFVAAAAGVPVAKHGNRAVSSAVGSADVLEALGVTIDLPPERVARALTRVGIGFMFAPRHHGATRHVGPIRKALGFRTIFNLLGPLTNPASATHQLLGLFDGRRLRLVAEVLGRLGVRRALVVHGPDGLDELGLAGSSRGVLLDGGALTEQLIDPRALGLEVAPIGALRGGDVGVNAAIARAVLGGRRGPHADIVALNAAAALWVAELAPTLGAGLALARDVLASGAALAKLDALVRETAEP